MKNFKCALISTLVFLLPINLLSMDTKRDLPNAVYTSVSAFFNVETQYFIKSESINNSVWTFHEQEKILTAIMQRKAKMIEHPQQSGHVTTKTVSTKKPALNNIKCTQDAKHDECIDLDMEEIIFDKLGLNHIPELEKKLRQWLKQQNS